MNSFITKGIEFNKRIGVGQEVGDFFNETNNPFNVAWHLTFTKVMKATLKSWTYYKFASYYGLHTNLLKQSKVDMSKHVVEKMWNSIHKYGTTTYCDGWDIVIRRPLLNMMFTCPNVDVFLNCITTTMERKDAHTCNTLVGYSETVGMLDNIIQICTNNVSK